MSTQDDSEPRIHMRHARQLGYCTRGSERLSERFGMTFEEFLEKGYPVSEAEKSNNPLLRKAAMLARAEWEEAHGNGK
ncbi:tail assembly chaperone [Hafnia phage Enc34]|uniref:Tail assembly protein n=1 Tax=Hafnia phage Enc34 TaxID=1150990 RepID=H6WYI5_9CAUD|nr:tail assembly chaperone [Hafnia phage Enc34]AFB84040.1 tail assembly protein [Hafnia phage Enc34]